MKFPFGKTVTLHSRALSGQDDYGNDVYTETDTTYKQVAVWARGLTFTDAPNTKEITYGQDSVIKGLWALLPTRPLPTDQVTVDGIRYEVDGDAAELHSPLTNTHAGYQVALARVTG